MFFILLYGLMLILAVIHLIFMKKPRTLHNVCQLFLLYLLIGIGLSSFNAYLLHVFYAATVAKVATSLFQYQLGMAYLGIGVLGILCIFIRGNFWLATIIMNTVFNWGVALRYLRLMIQTHQYRLGGIGLLFDLYILIPLLTIILYIIIQKQKPSFS